MTMRWLRAALLLCLAACDNSPYPLGSERTSTLFMAFQGRSPRFLDPTASYAENESPVVSHVHEALYSYHYLIRPYTLVPKAAAEVVPPRYLDAAGHVLPEDAPGEKVAESVYDIPIRRGVMYAPHPAFAKDAQGHHRYHTLTARDTDGKRSPFDFEFSGTRELVAEDFVYAFKRHATPRIQTPMFALFSEYVVGLKAYGARIRAEDKALRGSLDPADPDKPFLDFRRWPLEGVQALDAHTLRIRIKGKYPQWKYWLAMTFAAPIPWEAEKFYAQPGMARQGLALSRWPVGTGPYMLREYEQDRRHVLVRNPNYHHDPYPCEGDAVDRAAGLLDDCGKPMPFIDRIEFRVEKEKVPLKAKFAQGYLDVPEAERVDWGINFLADMSDADATRDRFNDRGFKFPRTVDLTTWYIGFNMLDPVVGRGDTPERQLKNRRLRQALSIATDWEEAHGRIFLASAGDAAHGPVPAGIRGSRHGTVGGHNPVTHELVDGQVRRRSVAQARRLMAEAGYPDGRDAVTGRPLVLNYDYLRAPTPELRAELDWTVKQFAKLGVQLEIRATDFNQYQEKTLKGKHQVFFGGWVADYPDAENFLFLLYGPNSRSKHEGENVTNYASPAFDQRFTRMQLLEDGPDKQQLIDEMVGIARNDAPWIFGYHPHGAGAYAPWVYNGKPGVLGRDPLRYLRLDPELRARRQAEWNQPVTWPLWGAGTGLLAFGVLGWRAYRRREGAVALPGRT